MKMENFSKVIQDPQVDMKLAREWRKQDMSERRMHRV